MTRRIFCLLALIGFWSSSINAQWQAVPSPADRVFAFVQSGSRIFAGSEDSGLWLSSNGGVSFAIYPTGLAEMNFDIQGFEVRQDTLWAAIVGGGVCRSRDAGTTWSAFNDGFETQSFVVGVKQIGDTVYAGTSDGLYVTRDFGENWQRLGTQFQNTVVDENRNLPRVAALEQNYPNPFWSAATSPALSGGNPSTAISFTLPKAEFVTLKIYNMLGKEVAAILNRERREAGRNTAVFTAPNLASGVYFYRLTAGSFTETKKMLLAR